MAHFSSSSPTSDDGDAYVYPGYRVLSDALEASKNTIQRSIARLIDLGLLEVNKSGKTRVKAMYLLPRDIRQAVHSITQKGQSEAEVRKFVDSFHRDLSIKHTGHIPSEPVEEPEYTQVELPSTPEAVSQLTAGDWVQLLIVLQNETKSRRQPLKDTLSKFKHHGLAEGLKSLTEEVQKRVEMNLSSKRSDHSFIEVFNKEEARWMPLFRLGRDFGRSQGWVPGAALEVTPETTTEEPPKAVTEPLRSPQSHSETTEETPRLTLEYVKSQVAKWNVQPGANQTLRRHLERVSGWTTDNLQPIHSSLEQLWYASHANTNYPDWVRSLSRY